MLDRQLVRYGLMTLLPAVFLLSGCRALLGTLGWAAPLSVTTAEWIYNPDLQRLSFSIVPGDTGGNQEYGFEGVVSGRTIHIRGYAKGSFLFQAAVVQRSLTVQPVAPGRYEIVDASAGRAIGVVDTATVAGSIP